MGQSTKYNSKKNNKDNIKEWPRMARIDIDKKKRKPSHSLYINKVYEG